MSAYGQQINAGEELPVGLLVYDNWNQFSHTKPTSHQWPSVALLLLTPELKYTLRWLKKGIGSFLELLDNFTFIVEQVKIVLSVGWGQVGWTIGS